MWVTFLSSPFFDDLSKDSTIVLDRFAGKKTGVDTAAVASSILLVIAEVFNLQERKKHRERCFRNTSVVKKD